jgi:hypothetical protein
MPGYAPAQTTFNDDPAESAPLRLTNQYAVFSLSAEASKRQPAETLAGTLCLDDKRVAVCYISSRL